jgi:outer membrane protein OmpA-like peptidoglycan-associated protein
MKKILITLMVFGIALNSIAQNSKDKNDNPPPAPLPIEAKSESIVTPPPPSEKIIKKVIVQEIKDDPYKASSYNVYSIGLNVGVTIPRFILGTPDFKEGNIGTGFNLNIGKSVTPILTILGELDRGGVSGGNSAGTQNFTSNYSLFSTSAKVYFSNVAGKKFSMLENKLNIYGQLGLGVSFLSGSVTNSADLILREQTNNIALTFPVGLGLEYRVSKRLDLNAGFKAYLFDTDGLDLTATTAGFDKVTFIHFGARIHLGKKDKPLVWALPINEKDNPESDKEMALVKKKLKDLDDKVQELDNMKKDIARARDDIHKMKFSGFGDELLEESGVVGTNNVAGNTKNGKSIAGNTKNQSTNNYSLTEYSHLPIIYFYYDSYEVSLEGIKQISEVSRVLKNNPSMKVRVIGHTDEYGTKDYNQQLGKRRAEAVYQKMVFVFGVPKNQIIIDSKGKEFPLSIGRSEIAKSYNRRVEFDFE